MSIYKKIVRRPSIADLAKNAETNHGWEWSYASDIEKEYIKHLSAKDLLAYRQQREEETFLDNI